MTKVITIASARAGTRVQFSATTTPIANTHATLGRMLHKRLAAPTWSTPIDPAARQAAIENALSMALYFVRQPGDNPADLWAATARTNRALTLLKCAGEGATAPKAASVSVEA